MAMNSKNINKIIIKLAMLVGWVNYLKAEGGFGFVLLECWEDVS